MARYGILFVLSESCKGTKSEERGMLKKYERATVISAEPSLHGAFFYLRANIFLIWRTKKEANLLT